MNLSAIPEEQINLHTHTYRCQHASGDVADYCQAAQRRGLRVLGLSDHAPFPDGRHASTRMHWADFPDYSAEIDAARKHFPGMSIFRGVEGEYVPSCHGFFRDLLDAGRLDYMVGSLHYFWIDGKRGDFSDRMSLKELRCIVDDSIGLIRSGVYDFFAHPDLFLNQGERWTPEVASASREIITAAKEAGMVLELNGYGWRKPPLTDEAGNRILRYPVRPFWELAAEIGGVEVVINSDAHTPSLVCGTMPELFALAGELGLRVVSSRLAESIARRVRSRAGSDAPTHNGSSLRS